MDKIILQIREVVKNQRITEQSITNKTGIPQSTVHRLIFGENKKIDLSKIRKIQAAVGIVSEPETPYESEQKKEDLMLDEIEKLLIKKTREKGKAYQYRWIAEMIAEEEEAAKAASKD